MASSDASSSLELFTKRFAFLTPVLLPWLQRVCYDSAEAQLKALFETPLKTPPQIVSSSNFSYQLIRESIIPKLVEHIKAQKPSPADYLKAKLARYNNSNTEPKKEQEQGNKDNKLESKDEN